MDVFRKLEGTYLNAEMILYVSFNIMLNDVTLLHYSALLASQVYCNRMIPETISYAY